MVVWSPCCSLASRVYRAAVMMCVGLSLQDYVALRAEVIRYVGCGVDCDVGQRMLAGLFSPFCRLRPLVFRDVLVFMFWCGQSMGEGFYPVQGDGVFPQPAGQDVYAWVNRHCAQVHVAVLPVMVGAGSSWCRGEVHRVEQGGWWCSQRELSMPYGVMCTAKFLTAHCSLWR